MTLRHGMSPAQRAIARLAIAWPARPLVLAGMAILLAACADVDVSPERAISSDIDAVHDTGSGSTEPGIVDRREPFGSLPWELDERR